MKLTPEEIQRKYEDPSYGLMGVSKFVRKLQEEGYKNTTNDVKDAIKENEQYQLMKKSKVRKTYKINGTPNTFQIDTIFLNYTRKEYIFLVLIDILTRKAFMFEMKKNTIEDKINALEKMLESEFIASLEGDDEFNKKTFLDFLKEKEISYSFDIANNEHILKGSNRLGIIDRFVRTIRSKIVRYMVEKETIQYVDQIPLLLENYNNTPNEALYGKTPNQVYNSLTFQMKLMELNNLHNKKVELSQDRIKLGDFVRILLEKKQFEKEGQQFSNEIYVVWEKKGNRYILSNLQKQLLRRRFKYDELQKVSDTTKVDGKTVKEILDQEKRYKKKERLVRRELGVNLEEANKEVIRPLGGPEALRDAPKKRERKQAKNEDFLYN